MRGRTVSAIRLPRLIEDSDLENASLEPVREPTLPRLRQKEFPLPWCYALPTSREMVDSKRFWWHRLSSLCGDFRTAWKGCATSQKNLWVKIGPLGERGKSGTDVMPYG